MRDTWKTAKKHAEGKPAKTKTQRVKNEPAKTKAQRLKAKPAKPTPPAVKDEYSYDALHFNQRSGHAPSLVMFHAPAREILEWAEVSSLGPKTSGPQRARKDSKVVAIMKFLEADARNTIPTAVTLAFQASRVTYDDRKNEITFKAKSSNPAATIVDGQHRLHGISLHNPDTEVAVVALLESDEVERAFQFLVINNKATKVPTTHTKALIARMKKTALDQRLKGARIAFDAEGINDVNLVNLDKDSPFYQSIDWAITRGEKLVQATAIELSLHYLSTLGVSDFEDRDVRRSVFLTIWKKIKSEWGTLWKKDSRLVSKVGVICLTRFIADTIVKWADNEDLELDVTDLDTIEQQTSKIIKHMNIQFWQAQWAETAQGGFDTAQGRDRVYGALERLYRNSREGKEWYDEIDIIDAATTKSEPPRQSNRRNR